MTCEGIEALYAKLPNEPTDTETLAAARHLNACPKCMAMMLKDAGGSFIGPLDPAVKKRLFDRLKYDPEIGGRR